MSQERRTGSTLMAWLGGLALLVLLSLQAACDAPDTSMADADAGQADGTTAADAEVQRVDGIVYASDYAPRFTADGQLIRPVDPVWREWPELGTPLTPNALNNGEAPFPEFHQVYIDPVSWEHWRRTGTFREGTVIAKELISVLTTDAFPDGSTLQVSGRGYFMGDFSGFEIAYKSNRHFPNDPGNWAYFTFGHHAPPYARTTAPESYETCSACHQASAAEDFVFTQFYPILRAARGSR